MKIGFIGLGKLGMCCALAIESKGHDVIGWDINPQVSDFLQTRKLPYQEEGADELLAKTKITLTKDFSGCDIVFIAVQTPHEKEYEGITPLPETRKDFNYSYLVEAVKFANDNVPTASLLVIISTCLPGTIEREVLPISLHQIVYNPFFIAMGTTIKDFLNPEFVLLGGGNNLLSVFYNTIHNQRHFLCSIQEAEMIKVSYNTFITAKICIANTIMEMCHKLDISSDRVMDALKLGTDRIISTKYLSGGMGDGGGCHPRDNLALSWLAKEVNLSFDLYESLMKCRDRQTKWLSEVIVWEAVQKNLPVVVLGKSFKSNVNITTGSAALLLISYLKERNINFIHFDPHIDEGEPPITEKAVYFIATNHDCFKKYIFPEGSEVIDVWRYLHNATIKIG